VRPLGDVPRFNSSKPNICKLQAFTTHYCKLTLPSDQFAGPISRFCAIPSEKNRSETQLLQICAILQYFLEPWHKSNARSTNWNCQNTSAVRGGETADRLAEMWRFDRGWSCLLWFSWLVPSGFRWPMKTRALTISVLTGYLLVEFGMGFRLVQSACQSSHPVANSIVLKFSKDFFDGVFYEFLLQSLTIEKTCLTWSTFLN
jgi:hypothetical protein